KSAVAANPAPKSVPGVMVSAELPEDTLPEQPPPALPAPAKSPAPLPEVVLLRVSAAPAEEANAPSPRGILALAPAMSESPYGQRTMRSLPALPDNPPACMEPAYKVREVTPPKKAEV